MIKERGKNLYEIAVDMGKDGSGKRIRKYERFKGSKKDAKAREAEIKLLMTHGTYVTNNTETVKSYFEAWLEIYVKHTLKPKTHESYVHICNEFIDYFGSMKLKSLAPLNLMDFYNYLRDRGNNQKEVRHQNKRLTENTVLRYYAVINVALKHAVEWQYIAYNPNEKVKRPKKVKKESVAYDLEQTQTLLRAVDGEDIKTQAIIRLALDMGCRLGELTGLEWNDIDLRTGIVSISKTTQRVNHQLIESTPKNNSSIRTIRISDPTIKALEEYKKYIDDIRDQFGSKWLNTKKIFTSSDGGPIHPDVPRKMFRRVLEKYNLPIIKFHGLRHTSASLQVSRGISISDVSRRLGHADISTTLNIYSHAFDSGNQRIISEFNNIFNTKEG